ncbi:type II toxin-antitoxin system VapC family toxin [Bifidobacterium amazonense]|uniref:Ribonuclease VapC n=1 Tax=Bifidobacterium amazonense TaxID=2809027 RepID=A0ABS9VTW7_9BIFI|nr:type II toxin-antitoxin system VapC family toxin [Bifidobacterium amazonense]MCH9275421.1 type II toxin-antitoxin system VapC family toxin [Bifidobacterium amazonense]
MIILDTNVISETIRQQPNPQVAAWYRSQPISDLCVTAVTLAELLNGVRRMSHGRRRTQLAATIDYALLPLIDRIFAFDNIAAIDYADIRAAREASGRPIGVQDAMIAAIARSRGATLATRNIKDFEHTGVTLVNPWENNESATA